jgi:hypothetical protein
MTSFLIVSVMVAGIAQGQPMELQSITSNCCTEQLVVDGINKSNVANNVNVQYITKCVSK